MQQPVPGFQQFRKEKTPAPPAGTACQRRAAKRRRARLYRRLTALAVMLVLAAGLFVAALLISQKPPAAPPSLAAPSVSPPSTPVSVPAPVAPPPKPQRTPTPYDEDGIPPLFNFENPIPQIYTDEMELVDVGGGHRMEKRAADAFNAMAAAAGEDGLELARVSGYRTNQQQTNNYQASIQRYLDQGLSREKAVELTEGYYAIPGTSEHEAGLAMDIGFIEDSFEDTDEFTWLSEHAIEYGFILRYREEDFDVTRIHYEPWHYRYVGANHAEKMAEFGITTLEDYVRALAGGVVQPDKASGSN